MAKNYKPKQYAPEQPKTVAAQVQMTLDQSKAYRAALHKPVAKVLTDAQKREAFRVWWTGHKNKYGKSGKLELALWMHLKATGMDKPEDFEAGIFNFGIKKVK